MGDPGLNVGDAPTTGYEAGAGASPATRFFRFLVMRALTGLFVVWAAVTIVFFVFRALPGSSNLQLLLGGAGVRTLDAAQVAAVRAELGLDEPLFVQYGIYLGGLLHGDLGTSYLQAQPVASLIGAPLISTLQLTIVALALAWLLALTFTLLTAGRAVYIAAPARAAEIVVASLPQFWLALMLLIVFAISLRWFPVAAGSTPAGMMLPAFALAAPLAGMLGQLSRQTFEEILEQPFILSSRARGSSETRVRVIHALRHSLAAPLALSGQAAGWLVGGALVIEQIFARPGIGRSVFQAVGTRDLPVILGVVIAVAVGYVVVNVIVDSIQRLVDPRVAS